MDQAVKVPYKKKITLPIELFESLPSRDSDNLQEELMDIYYNENPDVLKSLVSVSGDDINLLQLKKEQKFQNVMNSDYAFEVNNLRERADDEIATRLVEEIDKYNAQVEKL